MVRRVLWGRIRPQIHLIRSQSNLNSCILPVYLIAALLKLYMRSLAVQLGCGMHTSTHPNQIRSACERCRRQKLRCSRPTTSEASCARCTRLNLSCQSGSQRRVGRPPRGELVRRRDFFDTGYEPLDHPRSPDGFDPLNELLNDDLPRLEWPTSTTSLPSFSPSLLLPSENHPLRERPSPPSQHHELTLPTNVHFETLSRLNVDIHREYDNMARFSSDMTFEEFICSNEFVDGYANLQMVNKSAQEFLVVIKALHRQMGARKLLRQNVQTSDISEDVMALAMDPALADAVETLERNDSTQTHQPTYDSPTIFLVISCFVQLIKHLELVFKIIHDRVSDTSIPLIGPAPMAFADVPLIESSSQFILFCELMSHILCQTNLVLGLPSLWSKRSSWTGLLKENRYREMVNTELGEVGAESGWTKRPGRLLEKIRETKDLFVEASMAGL